MGRHAQGAPRVTSEIPPLPGGRSRLEPEGPVEPQCPDTGDVRASVAIDRCQPAGVPVRPARAGAWLTPCSSRAATWSQSTSGSPYRCREVLRFHVRLSPPQGMSTTRNNSAAEPSGSPAPSPPALAQVRTDRPLRRGLRSGSRVGGAPLPCVDGGGGLHRDRRALAARTHDPDLAHRPRLEPLLLE